MPLTSLEIKAIAMLASMTVSLEPILERLSVMELPDMDPIRHELAAGSETGLQLANLMVQLDGALQVAYDKLMAVNTALRANDYVVVAMDR